MIKYCVFEFEPVPKEEGARPFVNFATFGPCTSAACQYADSVEEFALQLPDDVWSIGFDQSTSTCGVFLKNKDNTMAVMLEKKRSGGESADKFMFDLERLIHKLAPTSVFSHILYEQPIDTNSFRSAQVLFQLEGYIRGLVQRYPEFSSAKLDTITNSSWRSHVICPEFSKEDRKVASFHSVSSALPWTANYGHSIGKDQDVYEAMGVMFGWFAASFDPFGRPYVRGGNFVGNMAGFLLPSISAEDTASQLGAFGLEVDWYMTNPEMSLYKNIASAVNKDKVVCVEVTDKYTMLCLCVEANLRWEDYERMTMVLVAPNFVNTQLYEITGKTFNFVL